MKTKLLLSLLLSFVFCLLSSQVPKGFNYQAVARTGSGTPVVDATLQVKVGILSDIVTPVVVWEELHSTVQTNVHGIFNLVVGEGTWQSGSAGTLAEIDWTKTPLYIKTQIFYQGSWNDMGSSKLWSVPYAMVANGIDGPVNKLTVTGETTSMEEALFEVKNKDGQTVLAVYNEGVRIYVDNGAKGTKGGFAIGGFDQTKAGSQNLFVVDPDSIRAYIDTNPAGKGAKGGFAIGGFDVTKTGNQEYLRVTRDSTRVYVNEAAKGAKGGFAIGGFGAAKTDPSSFLHHHRIV
jgi:hypothetical protein